MYEVRVKLKSGASTATVNAITRAAGKCASCRKRGYLSLVFRSHATAFKAGEKIAKLVCADDDWVCDDDRFIHVTEISGPFPLRGAVWKPLSRRMRFKRPVKKRVAKKRRVKGRRRY